MDPSPGATTTSVRLALVLPGLAPARFGEPNSVGGGLHFARWHRSHRGSSLARRRIVANARSTSRWVSMPTTRPRSTTWQRSNLSLVQDTGRFPDAHVGTRGHDAPRHDVADGRGPSGHRQSRQAAPGSRGPSIHLTQVAAVDDAHAAPCRHRPPEAVAHLLPLLHGLLGTGGHAVDASMVIAGLGHALRDLEARLVMSAPRAPLLASPTPS